MSMVDKSSEYVATIGIECHVQLKTNTKLFAGVDNDAREAEPNTLISPLCLGLPGTLPVLNSAAVVLAIKAGIALNSDIAHYSKFDRKHYFYPDLPLGYQITQFDQPTILGGNVSAPLSDGSTVSVRVHHAHIEADAGKSTHPAGKDYSLVDLNRAGTPLIEIVSEPDMHTAEEAKSYARELYLLMKYAGVSNANLYYGNMRFDVNVSVSKTSELGTRTETKNLNSFRSVEKAVEFETARQIKELEAGNVIIQETRGWDDAKQITISQRSKEDAHDYRYFPEPDIPPIIIEKDQVEEYRSKLPSMPGEIRARLAEVGVDRMAIEAILEYPELARRWEEIRVTGAPVKSLKKIADWIANDILGQLSESNDLDLEMEMQKSGGTFLNAHELVRLAKMVDDNLLNSTSAKAVISAHWKDLYDVEEIAKSMDLIQVSDKGELEKIVEQVISENTKAVEDYKNGEMKAIGFLVGQVMKASNGKANPSVVQGIIKDILT